MKKLPIGISDFKQIVEKGYYFVDTTEFIADFFKESAGIMLITRPRRFGKTLNMSMLSYFFDNETDSKELFENYKISEDDKVMDVINGFPVIFLTFKDIKDMKWDEARENLITLISRMYKDKEKKLSDVLMDEDEKKYYRSVIERTASYSDYKNSLKNLVEYMRKEYDKPVLLLIDEYDVPIQSGWTYGYYDEAIDFMRVFLSGALKDNQNIFKGLLTGIYRVGKESIFSGLNNLAVFSILETDYADYFGFTEKEIHKLIDSVDCEKSAELKQDLKTWYNGYKIGDKVIYNPWSVVNFLRYRELKPYWINTSSNDLIKAIIEKNIKSKSRFREDIELLLSGGTIKKTIDDSSALRELEATPNSIWALFLFSGYIKTVNKTVERGKYRCELQIPNEEVMIFFQDTVLNWLTMPDNEIFYDMTDDLIKGDGEGFCEKLKEFVLNTLSYYDIQKEPENTYHVLLLGVFSHLQGRYFIRSNRESGKGRYDVLLKAKDKNNFSAVIEIKANTGDVEKAMEQIEEKEYVRELTSEGYTNIIKVALGVAGKEIFSDFSLLKEE